MEKTSVLIVDDFPLVREAVSSMLENDYSVFTASSGAEGARFLEKNKVDVVFLDMLEAKTFAEAIPGRKYKLVVFSGHDEETMRKKVPYADYYFSKGQGGCSYSGLVKIINFVLVDTKSF